MIKITGTLHIDTGFVRLKPNINFIGAKLGLSVYDLSKPLEIELTPTPAEGLYLVDYTLDINAGFLPSEHWIIPNRDCTFDEVRGINQISLAYVKSLEEQITTLKAEIQKYLEDTEIKTTVSSNEISLNILKRFNI